EGVRKARRDVLAAASEPIREAAQGTIGVVRDVRELVKGTAEAHTAPATRPSEEAKNERADRPGVTDSSARGHEERPNEPTDRPPGSRPNGSADGSAGSPSAPTGTVERDRS